jgi:hypothetical protein
MSDLIVVVMTWTMLTHKCPLKSPSTALRHYDGCHIPCWTLFVGYWPWLVRQCLKYDIVVVVVVVVPLEQHSKRSLFRIIVVDETT